MAVKCTAEGQGQGQGQSERVVNGSGGLGRGSDDCLHTKTPPGLPAAFVLSGPAGRGRESRQAGRQLAQTRPVA